MVRGFGPTNLEWGPVPTHRSHRTVPTAVLAGRNDDQGQIRHNPDLGSVTTQT